jgi:hypothetical protein
MKAVYSLLDDPKRRQKRQSEELMRLRGDNRKPGVPRDVIAQAGSRGALITWRSPEDAEGIVGYRLYSPTEKDLLDRTEARNYFIALSSGASPSTQAVYVSCVSVSGFESNKVQVLCTATAEAGAPSVPTAPSESGNASASASATSTSPAASVSGSHDLQS